MIASEIGFQSQCFAILGNSYTVDALLVQSARKKIVRFRVLRIQARGLSIFSYRSVEITLSKECEAECVVSASVIRALADHFSKLGGGIGQIALVTERDS